MQYFAFLFKKGNKKFVMQASRQNLTRPYLILFNAFLYDVCKILNSLFASLNVA